MADEKAKAGDMVAKPVMGSANLSKSQATMKALEDQPKVTLMLERREGEFPFLDFCINGVRYSVERGKPCQVPKQIAELVYEKLASEGKLAQLSKEAMDKLSEAKLA